jgi:hypothetical protein
LAKFLDHEGGGLQVWLRWSLVGLSVGLAIVLITYALGPLSYKAPPIDEHRATASRTGAAIPPENGSLFDQTSKQIAPDASPNGADQGSQDAAQKMAALRKAIEALPKGNIVLDAPSKMAVADEREVKASVGINVPITKLRQQSGPSDQRVEGSLSLSPEMVATLSGPGFTIEQVTPEKQSIAEGYPTIWSWNVTAKQEGDQKLEATLYVLVDDDNETSRIRVESYSQTISVSVRPQTWGEWLDSISHELGTVKTIVLTIGAIVTAVLGWFGIRSRKHPPKK